MKKLLKKNLNRPLLFNLICSAITFTVIYPIVSFVLFDLFWVDDFVKHILSTADNRGGYLFMFSLLQFIYFISRLSIIDDMKKNKNKP